MPSRLTRLSGDLAVILVGTLMGLLILEIGIRIYDFTVAEAKTPSIVTINELGHTIYTPNLDEYWTSTDNTEDLIHVFTNDHGFVGRNYPKEKPEETYRIIALGDSFTAGADVNTEKNFISLWESELSSQEAVEFMNFGVGGQGTFEELVRYAYTASEWEHDLVAVFFYPNDFENNQFYVPFLERIREDDWHDIPLSNANNNVGRSDLKYRILKASRLIQIIDAKVRGNAFLESIAVRIGLHHTGVMGLPVQGIHPTFFMYQVPLSESHRAVFEFTGDLLAALKREVERKGARLVLVYLPEAITVDANLFEDKKEELPSLKEYVWDLDQPTAALKAAANKSGIPFLDLTDAFRSAFAEDPSAHLYIRRDGHFTEEGNALVARVVLPFFQSVRDK